MELLTGRACPTWFAAVAFAFGAGSASFLGAQSSAGGTDAHLACIDTLSLRASTPMVVYVGDRTDMGTDPSFADMADLFTQSVSQHVRHLMHGDGSVLPRGEPTITWRTLQAPAEISVKVMRRGPPAFKVISSGADSAAAVMLLRAATEAQAVGDGTVWPTETPGDSLQFIIEFALPPLGMVYPLGSERVAFPALSVLFPKYTPVAITSASSPDYPPAARQIHASGVITVDFEVDSTGHAIPESIRDVLSPRTPNPTGLALGAHNAFLASVTSWLATADFAPGRIGGCPIRQWMRQPINFSYPGSGE